MERSLEATWLRALSFERPVCSHAELRGSWAGRGGCANPGAYLISKGRAELAMDGRTFELSTGDVAPLLSGQDHVIRDHPQSPLLTIDELEKEMVRTDRGFTFVGRPRERASESTVLTALTFSRRATAGRFRRLLPAAIHLRRRELDRRTRTIVDALHAECEQGMLANHEVLGRLGEAVCIKALEQHAKARVDSADLRIIGGAVAALEAFDLPWTLEELRLQVGLSRSQFCERFAACFGEPPMRWLRRQRMELGASWLASGAFSVAEVAERLGYASESAFRKAFRRQLGRPALAGAHRPSLDSVENGRRC